MAKTKTRKTLDQHLHRYLLFEDTNEFIIFLVWSLLISALLISMLQ